MHWGALFDSAVKFIMDLSKALAIVSFMHEVLQKPYSHDKPLVPSRSGPISQHLKRTFALHPEALLNSSVGSASQHALSPLGSCEA